MKRSTLMVWVASGALAVAGAPALPGVASAAAAAPAAAGAGSAGSYHEPLCESRSSLCLDSYDNPERRVRRSRRAVLSSSRGCRGRATT